MGNTESDGLYFKESVNRFFNRLLTEHALSRVKSMPNYAERAGDNSTLSSFEGCMAYF